MKRRIAAIVFAIAIVFAFVIGISAEESQPWVGVYWGTSSSVTAFSAGSAYTPGDFYRLAFIVYHQGLLPEYTYEFTVSITTLDDIADGVYFEEAEFTSDLFELRLCNGKPNSLSAGGDLLEVSDVYFQKSGSTVTYTIVFNTSDLNSIDYTHFILACNPEYSENRFRFGYASASCTAVYDPEKTEMGKIVDGIDQIIVNQNSYYNTIIHYGQGNALPTDSGIGAAQENLHNAESTLKNKQQSLFSRASAGITTAINASQTHVSALAAPVAAVASNVGTAMEQLPSEVQAGFVAMPLVGLAAWLIGLKR